MSPTGASPSHVPPGRCELSQQAPQAHNDEQLLARIAQAAAQADLGRHQAAYPGVQPNQKLGCIVVAALVFITAAVAFAVTGYPAMSVIALAPLAAILIGLAKSRRVAAKNEGARLDLYEHGL